MQGMMVHTCHPNYAGSINRRVMIQTHLGINVRPYLKNKANKARGKAQVVEHNALSSNPSTEKKIYIYVCRRL
jgi:hypothetical protein